MTCEFGNGKQFPVRTNVQNGYKILELQKFFNFCVAHLPVKQDIEKKFPCFLF